MAEARKTKRSVARRVPERAERRHQPSRGTKQRLGEIDRQGSGRLRTLLVEAVWRLHRHNSGWRSFVKFADVFGPGAKPSSARKRKAVLACARLLMVDLWRLHTGRATLSGLGLLPALVA